MRRMISFNNEVKNIVVDQSMYVAAETAYVFKIKDVNTPQKILLTPGTGIDATKNLEIVADDPAVAIIDSDLTVDIQTSGFQQDASLFLTFKGMNNSYSISICNGLVVIAPGYKEV